MGVEILPLLTPCSMRSHTTTTLVNCWAKLPIMVPWVCRQIKCPSFYPKVGDVLEQLIPTIFEHIPLCFLCLFFSILDKLVLSGVMSMLYLYCLTKQPPDPSISRFLCCPISCTSSMLPHLNYLEKNASVVFHHILPLSFYCNRTWGESWGIIFHYIWWTLKHETFSGQPHLGPDTSLPPELGHISLPLQWLWFWLPTPVFYLDQCYQMNWPYGTH